MTERKGSDMSEDWEGSKTPLEMLEFRVSALENFVMQETLVTREHLDRLERESEKGSKIPPTPRGGAHLWAWRRANE